MTVTPDDRAPESGGPIAGSRRPAASEHGHGRSRRRGRGRPHRVAARIGELLGELVGEAVGDFAVQALSCLLLVGVVIGVTWGRHRSPGITLGTLAVLLLGPVAVYTLRRHTGPGWARRMGTVLLAVLAAVVVWFVLYGSNCGCV